MSEIQNSKLGINNFYEFCKLNSRDFTIVTGSKTVTFEEFDEKVVAFSHALLELCGEHSERFGILMENGTGFLTALMALSMNRSSATLLSPYFKHHEISEYSRRTNIRYLLSDGQHNKVIKALPFEKRLLHSHQNISWNDLDIWQVGATQKYKADINDSHWLEREFVLKFTSGVNGISKIVPKTYGNVVNELTGFSKNISLMENDVVVCPAPFFHSYGLIDGFLSSLYCGSKLVLADKFMPNDFIKMVETAKATIIVGVPFMYQLLCRTHMEKTPDFSSVRYCFSAGGKMSDGVAIEYEKRFGRKINQLYGSTETGVIAVNLFKNGFEDVNSVGPCVSNVEIKILDECGNELGRGETGEIMVKSKSMATGYIDQTEESRDSFKNGWYRTKDLGYLDENKNLYLVGRKSSFINIAGMKVDPFEVENVLAMHGSVKECAVVGVVDHDGGQAVHAFVVPNTVVRPIELIRFCKIMLADYKVPRKIYFLEEMPKSATGKTLKKYLEYQ
jgi:long-chain acyl-CoA synthetase